MTPTEPHTDRETLLRMLYAAFNARDIETVLAQLASDVDWPNAWEGGRVHGREEVRDYWTRQWAAIDPARQADRVRARDRTAASPSRCTRSREPSTARFSQRETSATCMPSSGDLVVRMDVEEHG